MELELTSEQEMVRSTSAKFIQDACPMSAVRERTESNSGIADDYLAKAGELGWFGLLVPQELGGASTAGEGVGELACVAEERGRGLQPGPFVPMNIVAHALAYSGNTKLQKEVLPGLMEGKIVASWSIDTHLSGLSPSAGIIAKREGDAFRLSGKVGQVQDGELAEWLLVTVNDSDGMIQFLVPTSSDGVLSSPLNCHDLTQHFSAIELDAVRVDASNLLGEVGSAEHQLERQLSLAIVLLVAETIGAMDVLFEMACQYAIDRIAFGRPIGSFQAIKHQLADMSLSLEAGKAISVAATRAAQQGAVDALEIAHIAKAWVGDTGIDIAQGCFQVFGGIGYTWEHDLHLFLRRITMNNLLLGQPDWHREQICLRHGI